MSQTMFVIPKPGLKIRNPDGSYLPIPPEGATVPTNGYWLGQLRDGSVTEGAAPVKPASAPENKPAPARHITKPAT